MRVRLRRFQDVLGDTRELQVEQIFTEIFRINA
jgi:hypothetical protein